MPTPFLHQLPLIPVAANITFSLVTDYAVVAGLSAATGELVLPTSTDQDYLVAGGIAGLPYMDELGSAGKAVQVFFPVGVTALLVATHNASRPVPQGLVSSMDLPAAAKVVGFTPGEGIDYTATGQGFVYPISILWDSAGAGYPPVMFLVSKSSLNTENVQITGYTLQALLDGGLKTRNPYAS